jgi:hypothetical protein
MKRAGTGLAAAIIHLSVGALLSLPARADDLGVAAQVQTKSWQLEGPFKFDFLPALDSIPREIATAENIEVLVASDALSGYTAKQQLAIVEKASLCPTQNKNCYLWVVDHNKISKTRWLNLMKAADELAVSGEYDEFCAVAICREEVFSPSEEVGGDYTTKAGRQIDREHQALIRERFKDTERSYERLLDSNDLDPTRQLKEQIWKEDRIKFQACVNDKEAC